MKQSKDNGLWLSRLFFCMRSAWFLNWFYIFSCDPDFTGLTVRPVLTGWLILSFLVPALFIKRDFRKAPVYMVSESLLTGSLWCFLLFYINSESSLMLLPAVIMGAHFKRSSLWWQIPAILTLLLPLGGLIVGTGEASGYLQQVLNNGMGLIMGYSFYKISELLKLNSAHYETIKKQNQALKYYAEQVGQITLLEERDRMSKELHDSIGHTFTSVIIGMDGLANKIKSDPDVAARKLLKLRSVMKTGLEEIRESIHQMASAWDEMTLADSLNRLAVQFGEITGTEVIFHKQGIEPADINYRVITILKRSLQEALTNSLRHGKASKIYLTLKFFENSLELAIKDDGQGQDNLLFGFGLSSMEERLQSVRGTITVESGRAEGTILYIKVPI